MPTYIAPFTFDFSASTATVDAGTTDVDVSSFYAAIKTAQASEEGIIYERIGEGSGLVDLGPGVQVGLTVELLGAWQIKFPAGDYVARIAGGNLVGGPGGDPVAYTAGVQTLLIQSAASTVVSASGSIPTEAGIAAAVLGTDIEGTYSLSEMIRLMAAALAGKVSGAGTGTVTIRDIGDTTDRIVASVDGTGNRTAVTLDAD